MSQFVYINFYKTTLLAGLTSTALSMTVSSSTGLPTLGTGQILPLVLTDAATQTVHEIVYCTGISGATLTIERGQEGTAATVWNIGDYVACDTTADTVAVSTGNPADNFQTNTLTASGLITANGGITVPSGQTETVAGTLDVTGTITVPAATASGQPPNLGQFVASLASPGYFKFPNGLILQWGLSSALGASGSQAITFPIAFPTAFLQGFCTMESAGNSWFSTCGGGATTGMTVYAWEVGTGGGTYQVSWMAIGH